MNGEPAELNQRLERLAGGLAVRAGGVDGNQRVHRLGAGKEAQAGVPLVSPMARPSTWAGFFWLLGSFRLLGRSMVLCSVTMVARSGASGRKPRQSRDR
jgi:hypothetical protein